MSTVLGKAISGLLAQKKALEPGLQGADRWLEPIWHFILRKWKTAAGLQIATATSKQRD
jgi:hypothetical protein